MNGLSSETEDFYEIRYVERQRLQGVNTRVITVRPRDGLRYGYRFWIDEKTGMPYRTQLETAGNEVIEEISFISPDLAGDHRRRDAEAGCRCNRIQVAATRCAVAAQCREDHFLPRAELLPAGFRVTVANPARRQH